MLLTLSEAAALLERKHGKAVHRSTVKRWSDAQRFRLIYANGHKVDRQEFVEWAARAGKLKHTTRGASIKTTFLFLLSLLVNVSLCLTYLLGAVCANSHYHDFGDGRIILGGLELYSTADNIRAINDKSWSVSHEGHFANTSFQMQDNHSQLQQENQAKRKQQEKHKKRNSPLDNGTIVP